MDTPRNAGRYKALAELPSLPKNWKWNVRQEIAGAMASNPGKPYRMIGALRSDGYLVGGADPDLIRAFVFKIEILEASNY